MVSNRVIAARLRELLQSSDLNTMTIKMLIQQLQEEFDMDLSDRKSFIKNEVILFQENEFGNNEEEEDCCDNLVEEAESEVTNGSDLIAKDENEDFFGKSYGFVKVDDDALFGKEVLVDESLTVLSNELVVKIIDVESEESDDSGVVVCDECLDDFDEVVMLNESLTDFSHEIAVKNDDVEMVVCEDLCLEFKDYSNNRLVEVESENGSSGLKTPETENVVESTFCDVEFVELEALEVNRGCTNHKIKVRKKVDICIEEKSLEFYDLFDLSTAKKRRSSVDWRKRKKKIKELGRFKSIHQVPDKNSVHVVEEVEVEVEVEVEDEEQLAHGECSILQLPDNKKGEIQNLLKLKMKSSLFMGECWKYEQAAVNCSSKFGIIFLCDQVEGWSYPIIQEC